MYAGIRKLVRWAILLVAVSLLLLIGAAILMYAPPIQDAAKRWGMAWLTEKTGMEIGIKAIRVRFPLRIEISEMRVAEILTIEHIHTHLLWRPLTEGTIKALFTEVQGLHLSIGNTEGTTQTDIAMQRLSAHHIVYTWSKREAHIRRLLVEEGDAKILQRKRTSSQSTTPMQLPLTLNISECRIHHTTATYTNEQIHLEASAERIAMHDIAADTTMTIALHNIALHNGAASLTRGGTTPWHLDALTAQARSVHYSPSALSGELSHLSFSGPQNLQLSEGQMTFTWHDELLSIPHVILRTEHSSLHGQLKTSADLKTIEGNADIAIGHADVVHLAQLLSHTPHEAIRHYPAETLTASVAWNGSVEQLKLTRCHLSLPSAFNIDIDGTIQHLNTLQHCRAQWHVAAYTYDLNFLTSPTDSTTPQRFTIPNDIAYIGELHYAPDTVHTQCTLHMGGGTVRLKGGLAPAKQSYDLQVWADSLDIESIMPDGRLGRTSFHGHLTGCRFDTSQKDASLYGALQLGYLEWDAYTFSNASAELSFKERHLAAIASYGDSLMQWKLTADIAHQIQHTNAQLYLQLDDLNLRALRLANTDIRPSLKCHATLHSDSAMTYSLNCRFSDLSLSTPTQTLHPKPLNLHVALTPDTALLGISAGDLNLTTHAHIEGLPWQWELASSGTLSDHIEDLHAVLSAGADNPVSNYLALRGVKVGALHAAIDMLQDEPRAHITLGSIAAKGFCTDSATLIAHLAANTIHANISTAMLTWKTTQMSLQGKANGTFTWDTPFTLHNISGTLQLSSIRYTMPAYSLLVHTPDTLSIPLEHSELTLNALPLYTTDKHPLLLDGRIILRGATPMLQVKLTTRNASLLHPKRSHTTRLYGKTSASGILTLSGPLDALSLNGNLQLRPGTALYYIYKDALLTANNQLDNIVSFVRLDADTTSSSHPRKRLSAYKFTMNININIDPAAQLEILLGTNPHNILALQGGGALNLQYIPTGEWRLAGRYNIEEGELDVNIPLLHVSHMVIRAGSTITWSGNLRNPQLDITAEERIRASVTLDGSPQTILFVAGVSITETIEKLSIQFTLSTPENASMQNTLASLAPDELNKLCVALLTTGLYLGEGGTGNLMNTALMSILQSQLDGISRDAFRTIDVSVGIEPLPDGVSGISTRTDYSFSLAKRLWNDRIRIIVGGSVTTSNERIEEDAVIDNISIEWRISDTANQYLRFFYDKNFESILEGEVRETGVGYIYRKQFN